MRAEARNIEDPLLTPQLKNTHPKTRRTLVMTSPGRNKKTGISISPSRLDPSLSDSMSNDQGSTIITDSQRALIKKMEQLVGDHHCRRNSGVSSLNSNDLPNASTLGNGSQNKMKGGSFVQKLQFTPQEPGRLSCRASTRKDRSQKQEGSLKAQCEQESRILKVPHQAQQIHLNLSKEEKKSLSPGFSTSPRFLGLKEQASDGNLFYKRLFDRFEEKNTTRKKSPYTRTPDSVLRNISSARESATSQESTRKASTSPVNGSLHQTSLLAYQNKSTGADLSEDKGYQMPRTFESDLKSFLDDSFEGTSPNAQRESDIQPQIQVSSPKEKKNQFNEANDRSKSNLKCKMPKRLLDEPFRGRTISFKNKKRFMSPEDSQQEINQSPDAKIVFPGNIKTQYFADLSSSIEYQAPQPSMESIDISFDESDIQQEGPVSREQQAIEKHVKRCGSAGAAKQSFNAFKQSFNKKTSKTERKRNTKRSGNNKTPDAQKKKDNTAQKETRLKPFKEKKLSVASSACSTPKIKNKVRPTIFSNKRASEGQLNLSFQKQKSLNKDLFPEKMEKSNSMTKLFLEKAGPNSETASTCVSYRSEGGVSESTTIPSSRGRASHQNEEKKCSTFKDMKNKKHNFKQKNKKKQEGQNIHFALFKSESNVKYGCIPVAESVISHPEKAFKNFVSSLREGDDDEETRMRPFYDEEIPDTLSTEVCTLRPASTQPDVPTISPISRSLAAMLAEEKKLASQPSQLNQVSPEEKNAEKALFDSQYDDLQFQLMENLSKQNSFKALQEAMHKVDESGNKSGSVVRRNKVSPLDLPLSCSLKDKKIASPKGELSPLTPQRLDTGYSFGEDELIGQEDNQEKIERTPRLSNEDVQEEREDTSSPKDNNLSDNEPNSNDLKYVNRQKESETPSQYNLLDSVKDRDFPGGRLNLSPSPAYQSESDTLRKEDRNDEIEAVAEIIMDQMSRQSSNASRCGNIPHELSFGLPLFLSTLKSVTSSVHNDHNQTSKISIFTEPAKLIHLGSPILTPRDDVISNEIEQQCAQGDKEGGETDRGQIMSVVSNRKVEKLVHKKSEPESQDQGNKKTPKKIQREAVSNSFKGDLQQQETGKFMKQKDELSSSFAGQLGKVGKTSLQAFYELRNLAAQLIQRNYRRSVARRKMMISLKRVALTSQEIKKQREAYNFKIPPEVVICKSEGTQTDQSKNAVSIGEYFWRGMLLKQLSLCALLVAKGYKGLEWKGYK